MIGEQHSVFTSQKRILTAFSSTSLGKLDGNGKLQPSQLRKKVFTLTFGGFCLCRIRVWRMSRDVS